MTQIQIIETRIREFVLKTFPLVAKRGTKVGDKWIESGLLDSFGILDLVRFLEEEFSIHISDEELVPENFQSLDAVSKFVQAKLAAAFQDGTAGG